MNSSNWANQKHPYIIIGSGIGALSCANFISRLYDKKVLVIEQHSTPGGLSGSYRLKDGVDFEFGIHQVGELDASTIFSKLMRYITSGQVEWVRLPDTFAKFQFPDACYEVHAGVENQKKALIKIFQSEEDNIHAYYQDIKEITNWYRKYTTSSVDNDLEAQEKLLSDETGRLALLTTTEYFNYRFNDKKLIAFLTSHWTDFGLPPSQSAFLKQAILINNNMDGVYYPASGSKGLIEKIVRGIERSGGEFLFDSMVKGIKYQGRKATSVIVYNKKTGEETELFADHIISGIGFTNTYGKLLPKNLTKNMIDNIQSYNSYGVSCIKLMASLKEDPREYGADQSLIWYYSSYDHDENFHRKNDIAQGEITQWSISFPSLKKETTQKHGLKINTMVDFDLFKAFTKENFDEQAYEDFKHQIGLSLLKKVEEQFPGMTETINCWELVTPLDIAKRTNHFKGNIFGIPDIPSRYKDLNINCHTPLDNVFLTGSDITSSGIYAAILSGVITTQAVFKDKQFFIKVLTQLKKMVSSEPA